MVFNPLLCHVVWSKAKAEASACAYMCARHFVLLVYYVHIGASIMREYQVCDFRDFRACAFTAEAAFCALNQHNYVAEACYIPSSPPERRNQKEVSKGLPKGIEVGNKAPWGGRPRAWAGPVVA
jgi:hypothetical protein